MRQSKKKKAVREVKVPEVRSDAAGIDVSPEVMYVAVDPRRDAEPVRKYGAFTVDLYRIANWLKACKVRTVALQRAGDSGCDFGGGTGSGGAGGVAKQRREGERARRRSGRRWRGTTARSIFLRCGNR